MKRSEALEEIRKILAMNGKDNGYGELEEAILHHLESLGMLPPPDKTDVIHSNLVYCYYIDKTYKDRERIFEVENSYGKLDYSRSKLWEPEDD